MKKKVFVFVFLLCFCVFNMSYAGNIRLVEVASTPQPENASITIVYPQEGEIEGAAPYWLHLRVRGFPLGTNPDFPRVNEVASSLKGQNIHVVVDNRHFFAYAGVSMDPFEKQGDYYQSFYRFKIPFDLGEGIHAIRVFACRSFGESLKADHCFDSVIFYAKNQMDNKLINIKDPYITYNQPSSTVNLKHKKEPVLLDFYVSNCELSEDGYKVKVDIDGMERVLTKWSPYYIYGLENGVHKVKMQLIDKNDVLVPGIFNDIEQSFIIEE